MAALADALRSELYPDLQTAMDLTQEQGPSSWLSALLIREHGFMLHKGTFRDAVTERYGWLPKHTPTDCSCGRPFMVEHDLSCSKGGFPIIRHNEIRDFTTSLILEVW